MCLWRMPAIARASQTKRFSSSARIAPSRSMTFKATGLSSAGIHRPVCDPHRPFPQGPQRAIQVPQHAKHSMSTRSSEIAIGGIRSSGRLRTLLFARGDTVPRPLSGRYPITGSAPGFRAFLILRFRHPDMIPSLTKNLHRWTRSQFRQMGGRLDRTPAFPRPHQLRLYHSGPTRGL